MKVPVLDGLLHSAHPPQHQLSLDFPVFFLQEKSKSRTELGELPRRERERERLWGLEFFWLGS